MNPGGILRGLWKKLVVKNEYMDSAGMVTPRASTQEARWRTDWPLWSWAMGVEEDALETLDNKNLVEKRLRNGWMVVPHRPWGVGRGLELATVVASCGYFVATFEGRAGPTRGTHTASLRFPIVARYWGAR